MQKIVHLCDIKMPNLWAYDFEGLIRHLKKVIRFKFGPKWRLVKIWRDKKEKWQILIEKRERILGAGDMLHKESKRKA